MLELGFIEGLTWLVLTISGLVGFLFSGEKILSFLPFWGNTQDKNSKILKNLGIILGFVAGIWLSLLILDEKAQFRTLTVALFVIYMLVVLAHPIRKIEGWQLILLIVPFILIAVFAIMFRGNRSISIFGLFSVSMWVILVLVAILMMILVIVAFFVEESFIDPMLYFVGWSPVVFVVCVICVIHGILLLAYPVEGLMHFIKP